MLENYSMQDFKLVLALYAVQQHSHIFGVLSPFQT